MNFYSFRKEHVRLLVFCSVALFFFSCRKKDEPRSVDPALEPYLNLFLKEGEKRGKTIDIKRDGGIILEFANLTPPTIGLCYRTLPVRVQIDRTYWKDTESSANKENLREDVVFHELGHGFLGRGHRNDSLPNNEWTSMMCGEPEVNGRNWAVNFHGYRKNYYLDELFNMGTPVPDWSKPATFDGNKGYLWDSEDYSFSSSSTEIDRTLTIKKGNGVCQISSSDDQNIIYPLNKPTVSIPANFYIEVEMSASFVLKEGDISGIFGGNNRSQNYFTVSSGNRSCAANTDCISPFAEVLISDKYRSETYNKLALCKRGNELFFYINDELVYRNDYQLQSYNIVGVIIPAKGSVSIKNYTVYTGQNAYTSVTLRAAKPVKDFPPVYKISLPKTNYLK